MPPVGQFIDSFVPEEIKQQPEFKKKLADMRMKLDEEQVRLDQRDEDIKILQAKLIMIRRQLKDNALFSEFNKAQKTKE